jgi:hypothetical protein
MRLALAAFTFVLAIAAAHAQDIEVRLVRNCVDTPLTEVVELITAIGDFEVEIAEGLRAKTVTLEIDHTPSRP